MPTDPHPTLVLARAVAAALPGDWTVRPGHQSDGSDAFLCGAHGQRLHMGRALGYAQRERLGIGEALSPQSAAAAHRAGLAESRITVAPERDPVRIAADIARRLLPAHRHRLGAARRAAAREQDEHHRWEHLRERILTALGSSATFITHTQRVLAEPTAGWTLEADLRPGHGAQLEFHLRVPSSHAPQVAEVLRQLAHATYAGGETSGEQQERT